MSNRASIATVTAVLADVVSDALDAVEGNARVTHVRPDELKGSKVDAPKGINVYLYRVSHSAALRNNDLPMRSAEGRLVQTPTVALELHYLLTFHGDDTSLEPQLLLSKAAALLRAKANLTTEEVQASIKRLKASRRRLYPFLEDIEPEDLVGWVRVHPEDMSLEALSKLWSVFFRTPYLLSLSYVAHVVLIPADETAREPRRPLAGPILDVVPERPRGSQ